MSTFENRSKLLNLGLAIGASFLLGSVFVLMAGANPLTAYTSLLQSAFSCEVAAQHCALMTTLQFAVPLLLSGLSALVAFRANFFSIGQAGQMLLGAAAAAWVGGRLALPPVLHPALALLGGFTAGAMWAWLPAVLKVWLGIHEVLTTLILNTLAGSFVGLFWLPRVAATARLEPLFHGYRLSGSVFIALGAAALVYIYLWRMPGGYEQRMAGHSPLFARYGGIASRWPVTRAVLISGGLAGLAGAVEVLGVHYRFVSSFSAVDMFDGLIVALMGQLHPVGVVLSAIFLGGMRAGSMIGLQIQSGVSRELGGALIALMLLFLAAYRLFEGLPKLVQRIPGWQRLSPARSRQPEQSSTWPPAQS